MGIGSHGYHKREAEPSYAPAIAHHPAGGYGYSKYVPGYSYTDRSPQGLHKREAEPSYAPALAYHPAGGYGYNKYGPGYSYTDRSPQGAHSLHKRQIGPLALIGLGSLAYAGLGLPGFASPLGGNTRLIKREAEPSYAPALAHHPAGGYGYNKYGPGYSYTDRSPQGAHSLHKRSPRSLPSPPSPWSVVVSSALAFLAPMTKSTTEEGTTRGRLSPALPLPLPTTPLAVMDTTSTAPATPTPTGPPRVSTRGRL